jgi:peptide/nickel transport system ATP-binding protein
MDNGIPLLEVKNLKTHFFQDEGVVKAVDGVSFDLFPSRTLGIVGESGCGKSVTSLSILRLVEPPGKIVAGEVWLRQADGSRIDLAALKPKGKAIRKIQGSQIALIFQEPMTSFSPVHTIGNQIAEVISQHQPLNRQEARDKTIKTLRSVGVPNPESRVDMYPFELSGGLRQRAMIAMALASDPRILIADEPTTALDVTTQAQILALLRRIQHEREMSIILITHDMGVIAEMADDVVVMYLGRVVEYGPVDAIFHNPQHPYTRSLLSSIPSIMSPPRTKLPTIQGSIPHPYTRPGGCPFHPRCPAFMANICDQFEPQLLPVNDVQRASCFLHQAVQEQ